MFNKIKPAFSIAEAMITLLIVSVALAAMAPIMSKKIKAESVTQEALFRGAVVFSTVPCPSSGWRDVGGAPRNWNGRFFRVTESAETALTTQEDAFQGHNLGVVFDGFAGGSSHNPTWRGYDYPMNLFPDGVGGFGPSQGYAMFSHPTNWPVNPYVAGTVEKGYGVPRLANETRPKNVSLYACEKI